MSALRQAGQLVVGTMRYRVLVLPDHDHICLEVLQKIRQLVKQGATIVGSVQPIRTNSLTDYPNEDRQVVAITEQFWPVQDSISEKDQASRAFDKGRVYTNMTSRQVLTEMGIKPDFTVLKGGTQEGPLRIDYIHRRTENADVYFVCNSAKETKTVTCRFRDAYGRAEVWYPVTGKICSAKVISRNEDVSCDIELQLPGIGSAFVVFRRDGSAPKKTADLFANESGKTIPVKGKWTVKFQPGRLAPESVQLDELIDWTNSQHPGIKFFSGTATYSVQFEMPVSAAGDYWLDLGKVCEVGEVSIDAHDLGTAWTYPFRAKVPAKVLTKGTHNLEVKVTNVWNNRLVGDQLLPKEQRITRTNLQGTHKKDSPLVPSGLLGPVTLVPVK